MKLLIAISCYLAVASAGFLAAGPRAIIQAQNIPVIGPNGVPLEPAANVAARAAHAAAHAEANARNAAIAPAIISAAPYAAYAAAAPTAYLAAAQPIYAGPQHIPVIGPNGVPLEPAENVAARAQHAAAHAEASARNGDIALTYAAGPAFLAGPGAIIAAPQHLPVIGPNGVPLEPAANVAARAQHAAAHIEAKARNGDLYAAAAPIAYAAAAPAYAYDNIDAHIAAKIAAGIL